MHGQHKRATVAAVTGTPVHDSDIKQLKQNNKITCTMAPLSLLTTCRRSAKSNRKWNSVIAIESGKVSGYGTSCASEITLSSVACTKKTSTKGPHEVGVGSGGGGNANAGEEEKEQLLDRSTDNVVMNLLSGAQQ